MILDKKVTTKWHFTNRDHYISLGYTPLKYNESFEVKVSDLPKTSNVKINVSCFGCDEHAYVEYFRLWRNGNDGKYHCKSCACKISNANIALNKLKFGETISFEEWCNINNRIDTLDRWDYEINSVMPDSITYSSNKRCYFKCPRGLHDSELRNISDIVQSDTGTILCSKCKSFAQYLLDAYGENGVKLYWGDSNTVAPWNISANHKGEIYIKCQDTDYHGEYTTTGNTFYNGSKCPYCSSHRIHPRDSFAQYNIDKFGEDFLDKYWDYNKNIGIDPYNIAQSGKEKVYINCQNKSYHGSYFITCNEFSAGNRCPYCRSMSVHERDSLVALFPMSLECWSSKNLSYPIEYSVASSKKVWWKCSNHIHDDYCRCVDESVRKSFRCPECVRERRESFLQEKVRKYISDNCGYLLLHEEKCTIVPINSTTKRKLPFDNEVVELKLIIEVHGNQHYSIQPYKNLWNNKINTPEQQLQKRQEYDEYKKQYALSQGYHYLAIPYWSEKDESYKSLIDDKISEILLSSCRAKEMAV